MPKLSVAPTADRLLLNGRPFFYLADTAWAAFSNLPERDWRRYLEVRRVQGFTAVQISVLPITHDTSISPGRLDPFLTTTSRDWDFGAPNPAYFDRAEAMVAAAAEMGLIPVLGVLWANYVPGTRFERRSPIACAMPFEAVEPYARMVAERFRAHQPTYFISGDTHFEIAEEERYYMAALEAVRAVDPDALLTMHLGPDAKLPLRFGERIDYYMYQSGHHADRLDRPYTLADDFMAYDIRRPIVNSEPPYEGHGRVGTRTRFGAFDVRKATWQSLLAGAKMGVAYGAHGVWSFHGRGMTFLNEANSFEPYDWDEALALPGGWDVGHAKWLFETYGMGDLEPADLVIGDDPEIRAAATEDRGLIAVYVPHPFDLELDADLSDHRCVQIDLAARRVMTPAVEAGRPSRVPMLRANADSLFLATRV